ncbi:P1 family peptidase [Chondromyces apiculatus]|uniref:D-aminopeptidase n=1 Tax=Chondromyces apiculatus DSM 436 TaxID=1192034 RepID=A0A017T4X2_9BACT|nr:P1 family peptidase [Chondromyces apiculatus]EYF03870.1 D-aminopeptidase [Chondromyces apiculatus DSM 436]
MAEPAGEGSITDVTGVLVGHLTVDDGEVQTGLTAILPYPSSVRHRKLFVGMASAGGGLGQTGVQVAEDFGTLSSPILLCNATTVGIAYDALITRGHRRDPELPVDDAWPPLVFGLDDGYLNDQRRRPIGHDDVLRTVEQAQAGPVACGSVGIGRGLCALGGKGGVGDGARVLQVGGAAYKLGVLCAANGGVAPGAHGGAAPGATSAAAPGANAAEVRSPAPGSVLVVATDAPLFPAQLCMLAEAALRGLDGTAPPSGVESRRALAFSTASAIEGSMEKPFRSLYPGKHLGEAGLGALLDAAASGARVALGRALGAATAVTGRKGRVVKPLDAAALARLAGASPGPAPAGGLTLRAMVE